LKNSLDSATWGSKFSCFLTAPYQKENKIIKTRKEKEMVIVQLIIIAMFVEAICAVGILIAFGAQADLLALVGIPLVIPYLGYILTGLLVSRGANFLHDIWSAISTLRNKGKPISINKSISIPPKVTPLAAPRPAVNIKPINPIASPPLAPTVATPPLLSKPFKSMANVAAKVVKVVKAIKIKKRST